MTFELVDSKVGTRAHFERFEEAQAALQQWIDAQRTAGEPVVEQPGGQWSDSRITTWISDAQGEVLKIQGPVSARVNVEMQ